MRHTLLLLAFFAFCGISASAELKKNPLPDWAMGGFARPEGVNPVIAPNKESVFDCPMQKRPIKWEESDTFNPAATVYKNKLCVLYRAEDNTFQGVGSRTSRLGLAETEDGVKMKRYPSPVMFPAEDSNKEFEWTGGCEDPRLAQTEDGLFVLTYTSWNKKIARLCVATSRDLRTWQKHGPAFKNASGGKYANMFCKSAAIVCAQSKKDPSKFAISKVNGKYFMYWGEARIFAATSDDLINWQPVENPNGSLKELIAPRRGYFDSSLTEVGPAAIKTKNGILVLYNGKNSSGKDADRRFAEGTYAAGQVLFDLEDPLKPIARLDVPFFRPMADFERKGQYAQGTVFIEGLAFYKGKWFMYYGCADSLVGVAVFDPQKSEKFGDPIPEYEGVAISENGELLWDFAKIEPAALNAKLAKFAKENPEKPLEVSVAKKVPLKAL
ncbi:MAG: hypothetical protein IKO42_03465 [Opitutales bacterium]|nr:hypothetical protein [Opitutales bacterium]